MLSLYNSETEVKLENELKISKEWKWKLKFPWKPNYDRMFYYDNSRNIFDKICYHMDSDKPPDSYKRDFFQVKKELHLSEASLEKTQEKAKIKKEDLAQQWSYLENEESLLRNDFIKFDKLLEENVLKGRRAQEKLQKMNELKMDSMKKISNMTSEVEKIEELTEKLKKRIDTHRMYKDYLQSVVATGYFKSINQIINRWSTLLETKYNIAKDVERSREDFQIKHSSYLNMIETSVVTFLFLSKELSKLEKRYDEAKNKSTSWEIVLDDIYNKYSATYQNICCAKIALDHVYEIASFRANSRKNVEVKEKDDLKKLLRLNETLKAMRRLEEQKQKLFGVNDIESSLEPQYRSFESKNVASGQFASKKKIRMMKSKTGKNEKKEKLTDIKPEVVRSSPLGSLPNITDKEKSSEASCSIKLDREKWKHGNVKDFEARYRKALEEIKEMKLKESNRESNSANTPFDLQCRFRKSKWAAAAVAQKLARDVNTNADPKNIPNVFTNILMPKVRESSITVFEDEVSPEIILGIPHKGTKFATLLCRRESRDEIEKGVPQLPFISSNRQKKGNMKSRPSTSIM